ncbi:tetratricopeptide repeat protein [Waterburya agarophytonicola K14]|uniref:non-specific serine/threonine protein kinase n=1 Tax=Waterburya agarophytonicola KI4 TaxID=2874699 RepID=A0A964FHK4_9CYAN|nr:serine/threonine-protein kinase [Waterburya agarophytonicola]MCC0177704.1 tetratricopeptide repeat protein [Waterburya agarophytonicola KI4]
MSDELIGGRYRVKECLRTTGFCETYVAWDTHLPKNPDHPLCVVKKLQPQSNEDFVLDTARRLFDNEAKVLYKLNDHPQIPRLLAHLEVEEEFYLVQEYIEGKDLSHAEIVPGKRWHESQVREFLIEVLEILAFVHQNNVIHRDIKPSNLMRRDSDGKIFLIDFGAVKEITNMTLTEGQGNVLTVAIGTPGYMASEQQRGDPRFNSDVYALGVTAVQAITGFHPDQLPRDRDTGEIKWRDRAPECSEELARILDKMVRNDFLQRYKNANEALEDIRIPKPTPFPPTPPVPPTPFPPTPPIPPKSSGTKRLLLFVVLPLSMGLLFLAPKIWKSLQALKYYNEGNALIKDGEYEQAIDSFDKAIANRSNFAQAWTNKGYAQGKLGSHLEKFSSCVQATDVDPDFSGAWNCRGLARYDLKQYERALQEYNQAIAVEPDYYNGWLNKGEVLLKLGRPREAIDATRQVLKVKPDFYLAWTQLCRALYDLEQYQDAKAHCEESLKLNPDYPPTQTLLEKVEQRLEQSNS